MTLPVVNARFLTQPITGVQRYAIEVSRRLRKMEPNIRFLTPHNVIHHDLFEELGAQVVGRRTGHLWDQLELSHHAGTAPLINLCNSGPMFRRHQLVTFHDAAPFAVPQAYSRSYRLWYRFMMRRIGKAARIIATDSEFSRRELQSRIGIAGEKIEVVPLGHEHVHLQPADATVIGRHDLGDRPFLLAVGSRSPHKNFGALLGALAKIGHCDFEIVIAGGVSPRIHAGVDLETKLPANVRHVGFVTDSELRALYEKAAAYVHPAYYEGFGLPPLEAMALGCPVISSNAASLPEVCGDAAVYFDPHDDAALAEAIMTTMADHELRRRLRIAGREQADRFAWDRTAERILKLSRSIKAG